MIKTQPVKKKRSEIKVLIFDLGNVLLKFDPYRAAKQFAKNCHVPLTRIWLHFFTSSIEAAYTRGKISSYEFYRHSCKALKSPIPYSVFRHSWNDIFWEQEGMEDLLVRLKKRYPLYLISNTNAMHFNYIKKHFSILKHFRKTFPSHEVGYRKPSREIYEAALKHAKCQPEEAVFIDDIAAFVRAAKKLGMQGIRFRHKRQLVRDLGKIGIKT